MEEKKTSRNNLIIILGAIICVLVITLIIYFCFFNKKAESNESKIDEPEDKIVYEKPDVEYSFNNLGSGSKNIMYDNEKAKIVVNYDNDNKNVIGISINDADVLAFEETESLYGMYQIGNYILIVKDLENGKKKEIYIYNFDGEFQMLQDISKDDMILESFEVNGTSMDAEFKNYEGTELKYNGKIINICNAEDLQSNNISDDLTVYEKDSLFYDGEQKAFFYNTDYTTIERISDVKTKC